jgi:hypothetical protein
MTLQEKLNRQLAINLELRRKLEKSRRDTVEYCAKFCEAHEVAVDERGNISIVPEKRKYIHEGDCYAAALRGIIGK